MFSPHSSINLFPTKKRAITFWGNHFLGCWDALLGRGTQA